MCGGDENALNTVMPLLQAMGSQITHCGPSGSGQTVKLCNQIAVCINNYALAEALVFCSLNNVDPAVMLQAISAGAAGSWQISNLGPLILKRDFSPGFKLGLQRKDLGLAIDAADSVNMPLLGTTLVDRMFSVAERLHGKNAGTQALISALETLTATEVSGE
jgi:3-hydroxyisobutyrate dehydrogenase